ncbi:MAG TPA: single-stranded DNA-binding protein [Sphingobacterium sp.]|nr:single-stranded DNA-binding protein [Sphingobacterium sp.]
MKTINNIEISGRLGANPEIHTFKTDKHVARATIAVSEFYKDADGNWKENTHWFKLVFWNNVDFVQENLAKGTPVKITGKLVSNSFTDKDGNSRSSVEISVRTVQVIEQVEKSKEEEE